MKAVLLAILAIVGALLLAGCSAEESRADDAAQIVERYLEQVSSGSGDRGWSLLLPDTRETVFADDQDTYIKQADATDWASFDWVIEHVERGLTAPSAPRVAS